MPEPPEPPHHSPVGIVAVVHSVVLTLVLWDPVTPWSVIVETEAEHILEETPHTMFLTISRRACAMLNDMALERGLHSLM